MGHDNETGYTPDPCQGYGTPIWGHQYCETPGCPYEHWNQDIPRADVEVLTLREIERKYGLAAHYWPLKADPDTRGIWVLSSSHLTPRDWGKLLEGAKVNWCREVIAPQGSSRRHMFPEWKGYMVWVPAKGSVHHDHLEALRCSGFSEAFIAILEIARRAHCLAVHFHPDKDPHPRLATFE